MTKTVSNTHGGTLTCANFSFSVDGGPATPFEADCSNAVSVSAGTHSVTEPAVTGYSTTYTNCSGVILANGGTATCAISNSDVAASLTVTKHVSNSHGGTAVASDFSITVAGTAVPGGTTTFAGSESGTTVALNAGSYTVSEAPVSGYTQSNLGDCAGPAVIGGGYSCTITNTDQAATLTVTKTVSNTHGGTLSCANFSFSVDGGPATPFEADCSNDVSVSAGTHSVTEPAVTGYDTTYANCTAVVLANGGAATCAITNTDQAATLTVTKTVSNTHGGTLTCANFSFSVDGGPATPFEADCSNAVSVSAGTHNVTEPAVAGYSTTYANCSAIVLGNGGTATCTITNDDQPATLTVIKHVINNNGGTPPSRPSAR